MNTTQINLLDKELALVEIILMFSRQHISLRITSTLKWIRLTLKTDFVSLQHLDNEPVQTETPGELVAYYKIARKDIFLLL
jgi:hypothetical protein